MGREDRALMDAVQALRKETSRGSPAPSPDLSVLEPLVQPLECEKSVSAVYKPPSLYFTVAAQTVQI